MELIINWLNGKRNYHTGAVYYQRYGDNDQLKKLLNGPKTEALMEMLITAMQQLLNKPVLAAAVKTSGEQSGEMPGSSDPVLTAIRKEWEKPFQQMNYQRHLLDKYPLNTSEQTAIRKEICCNILELEQQCMLAWARRKYYIENGRLPEVPEEEELVIPSDPVQLGRLIETIKRNIRRNAEKAKKHPDMPKYQALVLKYQQQLEEINNYGK